ncbi:MAG: hypothetical protein IJ646_14975 [Clostridia bacterium]|nr:hypothetical protein [Clostridia bacterium]
MFGYILLALYLMAGVALTDAIFYRQDRVIRLWLGLCAGLILMMWLPTLYAFFLRFTRAAQLLGLGTAVALAALAQVLARNKRREARWTDMPPWLLPALVLPLIALGGYLQYTHTLRVIDGGLWVGQSTYGDLCLHLGIATSLRNAAYPPDYSLLPGALLGYPFLADSMVTSMLLFGADLARSFVVTGTLMLLLVYTGFVILAWTVTRSAPATVVATVLMFVNGGLGFIYPIDRMGRDAAAWNDIFTGFYKTPTNQPELNLRWVNVICDMMIPQRTLLCGWMAVLPALWLLATAMRSKRVSDFVGLGLWAGALPMIHTHSFLALGLVSAGAMIWSLWKDGDKLDILKRFACYGVLAVALAAPQLLTWSVPQTVNGGSLRFRFNWVNNMGDGRLIDNYVWFWVKNVGLTWLLMVPAALYDDGRGADGSNGLRRALGLGALCVYVVAELIQFQPNEYDNNKLFYVAYMVMMPAMGLYLTALFKRLKGLRGRWLMAACFMLICTLSGGLSIAREWVSSYRLFSPEEAAAAKWIEANTPADATFLTGSQHNNAVAALTGRDIVCGTGSYLYFHGIDYSRQQADERTMLEAPGDSAGLFEDYSIDYAYISNYERGSFDVDEAWFDAHCDALFSQGDVTVYALRKET